MAYSTLNSYFARPSLAIDLYDACIGKGLVNATSGLFLSAQRRVGKTTFIQNDLLPYFETQGWTVVYIDLWELKGADPSTVINNGIRTKLLLNESKATKTLKNRGKFSVDLFGAKLELGAPSSQNENESMHSLILKLSEKTKKPVALFIDEAQKALLSKAGSDALFGLKSARDQLNKGGAQRLALVFTGSHQSKLRQMTLASTEAFYLATILDFPLLGREYVEQFVYGANQKIKPEEAIDIESAWEAFVLVGHRPELLNKAVSRFILNDSKSSLDELYSEQLYWAVNEASPLCKILIRELAIKEKDGFPAEVLNEFSEKIGSKVTRSHVQTALKTLIEKGLVMQTAAGKYILEDIALGRWIIRRSNAKK
jgi:hypothetical protein